MSTNDFEIRATLRARRLTRHQLSEAEILGESVELTRGERSGSPPSTRAGEDCENLVVETRVLGRTEGEEGKGGGGDGQR